MNVRLNGFLFLSSHFQEAVIQEVARKIQKTKSGNQPPQWEVAVTQMLLVWPVVVGGSLQIVLEASRQILAPFPLNCQEVGNLSEWLWATHVSSLWTSCEMVPPWFHAGQCRHVKFKKKCMSWSAPAVRLLSYQLHVEQLLGETELIHYSGLYLVQVSIELKLCVFAFTSLPSD